MSQPSLMAATTWFTRSGDWFRKVLGVALIGLIGYAYGVQRVEHRATCYRWLVGHWSRVSNYSHGPLVPVIAAGLVTAKWRLLVAAPREPVTAGAALVALAMLVYYVGVRGMQPRIVVFSLVMLLDGLVWALAGRAYHQLLFFPLVFLLFMIPLNFLDELIGFRLQVLMAWASTGVLNALGIETVRVGTGIRSALFSFDVANPCSGIRSLMAMMTVTAAFAYVTQAEQWKRWFLFVSAVPLAVLGNLVRVLGIALIGEVYGSGPAMTAHDYSGLIVFGAAMIAMVVIAMLLNVPYGRLIRHWTLPVSSAISPKETHEQ
jgi:exosortase